MPKSQLSRWALAACALLPSCGARTDMHVSVEERPDAAASVDAFVPSDAGPPGPLVCERELTISFTPTVRAQLAIWIEAPERFATIAVTEATARHGIGNRPGALQMNSGYRWPTGRRENVLPGWASARLDAGGAPFRRVIYRNRREGFASSAGSIPDGYRDTYDEYFCMSFDASVMDRDGLDAVTCASHYDGDKGRYLDDEDVAAGYAEPEETAPGIGGWRVLGATSAYPPRRDLAGSDEDHPDVARYAADALASMPELDAITMPTPEGDRVFTRAWIVPDDWPAGAVRVSVEVNTEGDYAPDYDPSSYPTPTTPADAWDYWAQSYGYPYRGQPSVIFDVEIDLPPREGPGPPRAHAIERPARRGTLDASLGVLPVDATIVDDPSGHPGSGADRLRRGPEGARVVIEARQVRCRAP